jgi:FAD binding domain/Berberine and berberine like
LINRRSFLGAGASALALSALGSSPVLADSRTAADSRIPWDRLGDLLQGQLVLPSDAGYATDKELESLQFDVISPQAIAYCVSPADVALCLKFAQHNGVRFAARSGGHSLGGYSTTQGLVIDVSRLNSVTLGGGTVSMGPGAESVDIVNALAPSGLAVSTGYCPTVAAGGYLQGGGLGPLTRQAGVAVDNMTAAQVVLANGAVVTASDGLNSDLYWAIRGGGGGNFGIVTSYDVTPVALTQLGLVSLSWSYDSAVDMLDGYARWLVDAPATIGGAATVGLTDAAAGNVPAPAVLLLSSGTATELSSEVSRLISMTGAPTSQVSSVVPYQALLMGVYGCAAFTVAQCHLAGSGPQGVLPRPLLGLQRSRYIRESVPRSGWEQAVATLDTGRLTGQSHILEVIALGGAANDLDRTATAYVHRDSLFIVSYLAAISQPPVSSTAAAVAQQWVNAGFAAIDPYSNGETYQNFIDPALAGWQQSYYAENYPRLVAVKAQYDPAGAFTFAQSIR